MDNCHDYHHGHKNYDMTTKKSKTAVVQFFIMYFLCWQCCCVPHGFCSVFVIVPCNEKKVPGEWLVYDLDQAAN